MTEHRDITAADSLDADTNDVDTNAVPLQPNPWTVTTAPDSGSVRIELPGKGIDVEIDRDLRFQLLDALHSPTAPHSPGSLRALPFSDHDRSADREEREL